MIINDDSIQLFKEDLNPKASEHSPERNWKQAKGGSPTSLRESQFLDLSVVTVTSRYRHKNQNSIYYLKPKSSDIYFLDFKEQGFKKEALKLGKSVNRVPFYFTSTQTSDATIFVVGGCQTLTDQVGLRQCLCIDANMTIYDRESMSAGRFNAPLALVRDRFILACGGQTSENTATTACEAYDIDTNTWFAIAPLKQPISNTSAVVMNNRFVYLMPGSGIAGEQLGVKADCCSIDVLDTGSSIQFGSDKQSKHYGLPIASHRWETLVVQNPQFAQCKPKAGI